MPHPPPSPGQRPGPGPAPPGGSRRRLEITNISDGGFFHWLLKFYLFGAVAALCLLVCGAFITYCYFATTLPSIPDLATYHELAATTTVVRAWDGTTLGELATERREILPYGR